MTGEEEPLDVDMSASRGSGEAVALVLKNVADTMAAMPDGKRYDFELTINESEEP